MAGTTASVALETAIRERYLGPSKSIELTAGQPQPLGLYYDLDVFEKGLKDVQNEFGAGFLHAIAVKSNPVNSILKLVCNEGLGAECASIGEILNCLDAGFSGDKIVYDSPVKTAPEIRFALEKGIHINADNFQEIDIIAEELKSMNCESKSTIGLRVNPIIGDGDIKELSCSSATSKFGIPMTEELKKKITAYFVQHLWLTALHVHIGSQSFDGEQLSNGLRKAVVLALEINEKIGRNQVCVFDIGGGYPVNRKDDTVTPTFHEYADTLRKVIPELFPEYGVFKKVITEFGQSLNAKDNLPSFKCPIYDHRHDKAILCFPDWGAIFGGTGYFRFCDLFINDYANTKQCSYSNLGRTYQPPPGYEHGTPQTKALLAGSHNFQPTEIEVFRR